jgi:hypothetical protein
MSDGDGNDLKRSFALLGTLVIAGVLYFLTNELVVAVVLPCLHGGWHTMETGIWLLASDPYRCRARVCFAFYFATACWKAAAVALFTVLLFGLAEAMTGVKQNIDEFAATMLVVAGGVVFNTFVGIGATTTALFHKIPVWVHPHLRSMVHNELSMVTNLHPARCGFNHAIFVVATTLVFPLLCIGTACLLVATVGKGRNDVESVPAILFTLVTTFGGPIAMIPCYAWLSSRIIARTPQQCWPQDTIQAESKQ